jgi:hypothetical protein
MTHPQQFESVRWNIKLIYELDELLVGKDLEGSGDGLLEVAYGCLPGCLHSLRPDRGSNQTPLDTEQD